MAVKLGGNTRQSWRLRKERVGSEEGEDEGVNAHGMTARRAPQDRKRSSRVRRPER